ADRHRVVRRGVQAQSLIVIDQERSGAEQRDCVLAEKESPGKRRGADRTRRRHAQRTRYASHGWNGETGLDTFGVDFLERGREDGAGGEEVVVLLSDTLVITIGVKY